MKLTIQWMNSLVQSIGRGETGNAMVDFGKDWIGYNSAFAFENHFELMIRNLHGRSENIFKKMKVCVDLLPLICSVMF
jgi:hypothetical protein